MILFIKFMLAIVALFIILMFVDIINGLRGKPSDYTGTFAFIGEGIQIMGSIGLGVITCGLALLICGVAIFG